AAYRELKKIFRSEKPDVVHLNSSKAGGLGALAARHAGVKNIIFTSHGLAWDEDRNILAKTAIYVMSRLTFLLCHTVITITKDNYDRARTCWLCKDKIKLVHNGIAPIAFLEHSEARKALNLPQDATIIGALGELTWNKNYHTLLHAAGILKRAGKNFLICIMGGGEEQEFLETLIGEEDVGDRVMLKGFVQDGARYLKAYDIFTLPSL